MTDSDKDLAYKILDVIMESFEVKPETMDFPVALDNSPRPTGLSLSSAGKEKRYLAHMRKGSPEKASQARYLAGLDMGSIAHDYIRMIVGTHPDITLSDAERTVRLQLDTVVDPPRGPEDSVPGHIDGFIEFDDKRILIDIKCVNLYTFNELDPRNPETNWWARSRKWAAGNYVFDAVDAFKNDNFKKPYIDQIACYEAGLMAEGEEWDATAFILYCRDTSHFAVGIFNPPDANKIVQNAKEKMQEVLDNPDPLGYDTCWEAAVGASPHIVCQYCEYVDECFDLTTTVFRGKPRFQIKRIK